MLKHGMIVVALFTVLNAAASANPSSATFYSLSGNEVRALDATFRAAQGRVQDIARATVTVAESSSGTIVEITANAGSTLVFSIDRRTNAVSSMSAPAKLLNSITLPGLEAKAVAIAYRAWISGATKPPASVKDLESSSFTVRERAIMAWPKQKPGYFVTYLPLRHRAAQSGLNCADFANYRVDPTSWKVFIQPKIC